ncbi:hypothetical protein AJ71_06272 [Pseudomonas aeruginosa BWH031]|jgi:hypothetical protein|nr:hypothetical protein Q037_05139 [Pseudomonas aeruginosa BWHPSA024]ERW87591.1 hypothetical protein Q018_01079 [Pseudomonas aeruginosa BWHPSA005]EZN40818.1 hypothetical protein AJ76_06301 [Pseudomonas aeruginosa BWH036]EZN60197.1 hypothetical protein AJ71_06272 [Pseudomonas aeruginosa BWH031]EZP06639.1 hypothetical protein V552_05850 [Pseudomonas aeruginosa BWH051]
MVDVTDVMIVVMVTSALMVVALLRLGHNFCLNHCNALGLDEFMLLKQTLQSHQPATVVLLITFNTTALFMTLYRCNQSLLEVLQ